MAAKPQPKPQPHSRPRRQRRRRLLHSSNSHRSSRRPCRRRPAKPMWFSCVEERHKVNEIVGKLRASGFKVYTSPSTPVQGKITRILVGPDASKDKLKGQLGDLQQISGLSGVVMGFTPN